MTILLANPLRRHLPFWGASFAEPPRVPGEEADVIGAHSGDVPHNGAGPFPFQLVRGDARPFRRQAAASAGRAAAAPGRLACDGGAGGGRPPACRQQGPEPRRTVERAVPARGSVGETAVFETAAGGWSVVGEEEGEG